MTDITEEALGFQGGESEDGFSSEVTESKEAQETSCELLSEANEAATETLDYESLIEEDLNELRAIFPELSELESITELENPVRYGALRDLGLSAEEAYRATTHKRVTKNDNRSHLRSSAPLAASSPYSSMSRREMELAREIFHGVSDAEIQRLYKKVTR